MNDGWFKRWFLFVAALQVIVIAAVIWGGYTLITYFTG